MAVILKESDFWKIMKVISTQKLNEMAARFFTNEKGERVVELKSINYGE